MLGNLKTPSVSEKLGATNDGMIGSGGEPVRARGSHSRNDWKAAIFDRSVEEPHVHD